jgi:LmbE family N-acetylglucosaminyl deacetylase
MRVGVRSRARRVAIGIRPPRRAGLSRPPIGAAWGWVQTVAGRTATDSLLPGGALVLSPHQDDETIGCGLLMAEKANRGIPVAVAVATDGRSGWFSSSPRPAPHDIDEIRRREWHRALDVLAVPKADRFELCFPDGELGDHESEVTDRIGALLRSVRPSQVFVTRPGDPHPDHHVLARATRQAVAQIYDSGLGVPHGGVADGSSLSPTGPRPQVFTYRVYPGEGLWPNGRPSRVTVSAAVVQLIRAAFGLSGRRALLFRASESMPTKVSAIDAYESQSRLLRGELRYVWGTSVELYWPMDTPDSRDDRGPIGRST